MARHEAMPFATAINQGRIRIDAQNAFVNFIGQRRPINHGDYDWVDGQGAQRRTIALSLLS